MQRFCEVAGADCPAIERMARRVVDAYEQDWDGKGYRNPCDPRHRLAGERLPWNQQFALGQLMVHLVARTGDTALTRRIQALLAGIQAELYDDRGVRLWHYWPRRFYRNMVAHRSCKLQWPEDRRPLYRGIRGEDIGHAHLTLGFIEAASHLLGRTSPINALAIFQRFRIGPHLYTRTIDGTAPHQASLRWRPYGAWLDDARIASITYKHWIDAGETPFSSQHIRAGYARTAPPLDRLTGTVNIEVLAKFDTEQWQTFQTWQRGTGMGAGRRHHVLSPSFSTFVHRTLEAMGVPPR